MAIFLGICFIENCQRVCYFRIPQLAFYCEMYINSFIGEIQNNAAAQKGKHKNNKKAHPCTAMTRSANVARLRSNDAPCFARLPAVRPPLCWMGHWVWTREMFSC